MIDIKTMIAIISVLITIGGLFAAFIKMQTTQNMEIKHLKTELEKVHDKQSKSTHYQIDTEKDLKGLNLLLAKLAEDMKEIKQDMKELKSKGCGRCKDE